MRDLRFLLARPEWGYRGSRTPLWFLVGLTVLTTARSLIHVFAPDGGAGSIAGIDISVARGDDIVAVFGQWGWTQLLLALVGWVVIVRYRFLVPAVLMLQLLDWGGRTLVGLLKPFVVDAPPREPTGTSSSCRSSRSRCGSRCPGAPTSRRSPSLARAMRPGAGRGAWAARRAAA